MGTGYLIDSNVVIDFFNKSIPEKGKDLISNISPVISIVTFIEIFCSNKATEEEVRQLKRFSEMATIYDIDRSIAVIAIELRKKYRIKLPDALIAATSLNYNLALITRNLSDFDRIEGLEVVNPYTL